MAFEKRENLPRISFPLGSHIPKGVTKREKSQIRECSLQRKLTLLKVLPKVFSKSVGVLSSKT